MAFHVALAYLIWSIVPHFHLLIHSHAGGQHTHTSLTGAQVEIANRVLENLGPAALTTGPEVEFGGEEKSFRIPGEPTLFTGADCGLHAHFWEDANLASAASLPFFAAMGAALLLFFLVRYRSPSLSVTGPALARGPPPLFA